MAHLKPAARHSGRLDRSPATPPRRRARPAHARRTYRLAEFTVTRRGNGWYFTRTARFDDKEQWRGPYSSLSSVTLMIARQLMREIAKRDSPYRSDE